MMKLYNTLTRDIQEFVPNDKKMVKMYTCGPTVYHFAHIGNLRTYIMEDVLEKAFRYNGYEVKRVMNITDVGHLSSDADSGDDKMVKGAIREHKSVMDIAKFYTEAFKKDCERLNVKWPETVVPATKEIDTYIMIIKKLLDKGYAYVSGDNVYFDTSKLEDYYKLSNHKEDEMIVGARDDVNEDNNKRNKTDFVLWFTKSKFLNQELKWDSPWGVGYPGWHIECSGISLKYLGDELDIHCGGVDNIFPHHTNEIAQSESYTGKPWCKWWFHTEHLNDKNGKMSKSKGEFLTLDTIIDKGYDPLVYRLFCLQSHYRKTLEFSYEGMDSAKSGYSKLKSRILNLVNNNNDINYDLVEKYRNSFMDALNDDLNTASAITVLFDMLKDKNLNDESKIYLVGDFDRVLSLDLLKREVKIIDSEEEKYILDMIEKRRIYKLNKEYDKADNIREELLKRGIVIKDTREGTIYSKG